MCKVNLEAEFRNCRGAVTAGGEAKYKGPRRRDNPPCPGLAATAHARAAGDLRRWAPPVTAPTTAGLRASGSLP